MAVDPSAEDFAPKVVAVGAVAVDDLAHHPLPDERGGEQLEFPVAAVFQEHEGRSGTFLRFDEGIAVLHGIGAADFERRDLAGLHTVDRNGNVRLPRGCNDDGVDRVILQQFVIVSARLGLCSRFLSDHLGGFLLPVLVQIADCDDVRLFHFCDDGRQQLSAASQSDKSNIYLFHLVTSDFPITKIIPSCLDEG